MTSEKLVDAALPEGLVYYIVDSDKSFYEAGLDLEPVVQRHGFAVLDILDLGETLTAQGIAFDDECRLFTICSYRAVAQLLTGDMRLSTALPWRISVFTADGATKIGLLQMAPVLVTRAVNSRLFSGVEASLIRIVDETR